MALRQDHERGIGEADAQVSVALDKIPRDSQVGPGQRFHCECALREIGEELELDLDTETIQDQVVSLGSR